MEPEHVDEVKKIWKADLDRPNPPEAVSIIENATAVRY
jgi:hypothetical protein